MQRFPAPPPWQRDLVTVGVTGTNGKTTTTTYIAKALRTLDKPVPRATTLGKFLDDEELDVPRGYPGFLEVMTRGHDRGATHAAAEYTSEALGLGFAIAWPSKVGVFTNLTRDHMNAHGSAEHYLACKAQLFAHLLPGGAAVLNACDPAGELLAQVLAPSTPTLTYAATSRGKPWCEPTVSLTKADIGPNGTTIELGWASTVDGPKGLTLRAAGEIFAENAMAALLAAHAAGVPLDAAARAIEACEAPPGRFEVVASEGAIVVVDYAHTPDALLRTVRTARSLARAEGGTVTVVFGAGGDRDKGKRPLMGAAASGADRVILTNDNPRTESPKAIVESIRSGIKKGPEVIVELDRKRAIESAVARARPGDVVVIAGKGHERGQVVGSTVHPFSDVEAVEAALRLR